jgi:hypothetical protein
MTLPFPLRAAFLVAAVADGCLAISGPTRESRPLLVYLHGRYARDAAADEIDRQRRLGARATG